MFQTLVALMASLHLWATPAPQETTDLWLTAEATSGMTTLVNKQRQRIGRAALNRSAALDRIAADHATDMAKRGYFSHQSPDGRQLGDRAARRGYRACLMAENIAKGYSTAPQVVDGWMKSKGHRKNMLHRKVSEFGVAEAGDRIWVMVLARPGC
ncbi:CAP domain-containing protein [Aliiruegeria sabulilitoris]|uniref:CAP domain-containing protein n=1 Tax=Aliiruegeria sabulilitoris TaxID=1510458 RepID=UPI00082C9649|nr:CAP domain-containing protein [Aliiruegeria sabulilitoris]NDR57977.1 CAP domain-containing protein [Pseudoruegeria sp. M32A2M]